MGFFILFPSFLMYQALVQVGYIPPVLGGYFTAGAALCLPFAIYSFFKFKKKKLVFGSHVVLGYIFFLFLLALVTLVGYIDLADPEIVTTNIATLLRSVSIFLIVLCFDCTGKYSDRIIKSFFFAYSIFVLISSIDGSFVVRGLEVDGNLFQVDYQTTAVVYILFLIYAAPTVGLGARLLLYGLAMPSLFYIGARSELIGFVPLIFVMEFLLSRSFLVYWLNMLLFGAAVLTAGLFFYSEYSDSRIFSLLSLSSDASGVARSEFTARALDTISENPLLGSFASYVPGEYSHNLLSVWVDFGMLGFLFILGLFATQGAFLVRRYRAGDVSIPFIRAVATFFMMVIMLVTAKNYGYPMIPIAMAFYAIYQRELISRKRGVHEGRTFGVNIQ
ncbi:hypothetical protein ACSFBX_32315 [Variovorax sp. RB2P76]|uniref:hypothetical protein n=1 Tax=Variovorax sp. RB2P76 TaxID=3443736 RepID=UPI003F487703